MKAAVRKQIRSVIETLSVESLADRSRRACKLLTGMEQFQSAGVVMVYLNMPNEVDTTPLVLEAFQADKTVLAPRICWEKLHMEALEIRSLEQGLFTRPKGPPIREPVDGEPWPLEDIDLIVLPALAFDRTGNRLGWGKGFYDRFLARPALHAYRIGLAFAEQVIDSVPIIETDQPVDALVTDREVMRFAR